MRFMPLPLTLLASAAALAVVGTSDHVQMWLADVSTGVDAVAAVLPLEAWWFLAALVALRTVAVAVSVRDVTTTVRHVAPVVDASAALDDLTCQLDAFRDSQGLLDDGLIDTMKVQGEILYTQSKRLDVQGETLDRLTKAVDALYGVEAVKQDSAEDGDR